MVATVSKSVIKDCEVCGKPLKKVQTKFCSHKCLGIAQKKQVERICPTCGKIFYTFPSRVKIGHGIFCSVKCWAQSPVGHPFFGHHHSEEAKEKKRQSMNAYFERVPIDERRRGPQSEETNKKRSQSHKELWQDPDYRERALAWIAKGKIKLSQTLKEKWQDPEFVAKMMASFAKKPTKPEKRLIDICSRHFPQYEYNGDGRLGIMLGGSIPDFPNVNGKKDLIEVFGDYYHSPELLGDDWKRSELGKIMVYNSLGWRCLVIWEHELNEKSEAEIVDMIKAFAGGRK